MVDIFRIGMCLSWLLNKLEIMVLNVKLVMGVLLFVDC